MGVAVSTFCGHVLFPSQAFYSLAEDTCPSTTAIGSFFDCNLGNVEMARLLVFGFPGLGSMALKSPCRHPTVIKFACMFSLERTAPGVRDGTLDKPSSLSAPHNDTGISITCLPPSSYFCLRSASRIRTFS